MSCLSLLFLFPKAVLDTRSSVEIGDKPFTLVLAVAAAQTGLRWLPFTFRPERCWRARREKLAHLSVREDLNPSPEDAASVLNLATGHSRISVNLRVSMPTIVKCVCVCLWSILVRSCPSEHTLIFNYFSSAILNAADRINIAQANVRITNVAHKANVVFIYAKQL